MKTPTTSIRLPVSLKAFVAAKAEFEGLSFSQTLNLCLTEYKALTSKVTIDA